MDLFFRDETAIAARKVEARQTSSHPQAASLQLDWHVRCREAFLSLYITRFSHSCTSLPKLYAEALNTGPLARSCDAVSLAFAAFEFNSDEVREIATKKYVLAVRSVCRALKDVQLSLGDEILQSVLLLDLYEKMMNRGPPNPQSSWVSHIRGALTLVEARGNIDLSNAITRQLASRVMIAATISQGATQLPIPDALVALRMKLYRVPLDIDSNLIGLLLDLVNLRATIRNGTQEPNTIAQRARDLDNIVVRMEQRLPRAWVPYSVPNTDLHPRVYGSDYDIYPGHTAAQAQNMLRLLRLETHQIIRNHDNEAWHNTSETINAIARKICDSVPQFILPNAWPDGGEHFSALQRLRCVAMLTPLYTAAQLSTEQRMQAWVCDSMEYIAELGNLKIASDVASILRSGGDVEHWGICAMTGSYAMTA